MFASVASALMSDRRRRIAGCLVWLCAFLAIMAAGTFYSAHRVAATMQAQAEGTLREAARLEASVGNTLGIMRRTLTGDPCGARFLDTLHRIAYLPDGLNELIYAPGGQARCSVSVAHFDTPLDFGRPTVGADETGGLALWIDRELDFAGLNGEFGTIVLDDPFAVVVPRQHGEATATDWMRSEIVLAGPHGRWWHRGGAPGVYARYRESMEGVVPSWLSAGAFFEAACVPDGLHCVSVEAGLPTVMARNGPAIAVFTVAAAMIAAWLAGHAMGFMRRYWSFAARFRRHFNADSIECVYQPVMHLESGRIVGCEVLARWRDIDGSLVTPDRFLPIVRGDGTTMAFTRFVVERAFQELTRALPPERSMQVSVNVFPTDLDAEALVKMLSVFRKGSGHLKPVIEIIESDEIPLARACREIDRLRREGIAIYIDDFGAGFSNVQNLAALDVEGIKLDRAFAMAPDDSLMARMLVHAIEMVHAAGRKVIVEGVETAERLAGLRATRRVDYVQGFHLSRPLPIGEFVHFLACRERSGLKAA